MSIEQVAAVGDTAQLQMSRMGYRNFHKMPRYDGSPQRIRRQKKGPATRIGQHMGNSLQKAPLALGHGDASADRRRRRQGDPDFTA